MQINDIKFNENGEIIDILTGKILKDTPEERVRQRFLNILQLDYGYPKENILCEVPVQQGSKILTNSTDGSEIRADIVVYNSKRAALSRDQGKLIQGKQGTPNYKIKELVNRTEDEMFITENAHEAIISRQDFDLVQRLMQIDTRISPLKDKLHLFSGILICGCCGNRMTRKTVNYKGNKYFYYYCPTGKKNGCNASNMVKEDELIQCVTESIQAHIRSVASLNELLGGINSKHINQDMAKKITAQIKDVQKQLDKCNEYKSSLYENFVSGILSKEDYKQLKLSYTNDGKRLEAALQELETELDECVNNTSKKSVWIEHFKQFENISEIDRATVIQLIMSIHIFSKTHLQITFNYKDEYEQALATLEEYKEAV